MYRAVDVVMMRMQLGRVRGQFDMRYTRGFDKCSISLQNKNLFEIGRSGTLKKETKKNARSKTWKKSGNEGKRDRVTSSSNNLAILDDKVHMLMFIHFHVVCNHLFIVTVVPSKQSSQKQ